MSILETLNDNDQNPSRVYGVVSGIVTNNKDPNKMGRVKVKFPWLSNSNETHWVRIATLMSGGQRGSFFLPEVDDEVLVAFEHGDLNSPFVIGCLWNGKDKPPENNSDGKNNIRKIKSRCGHEIVFDDTKQKEKLEIKTNAGHKITLDDAQGKGGVSIATNGGHSLEMNDVTGMVIIEDKNGNKITMGPPGVDINGKLTVSK